MQSLFRRLTHVALARLTFRGVVLDSGGSKTSEYMVMVQKTASSITVLNLDPKALPDVSADLELPLPCSDVSYDTVLAMNVLEHIYHYQQLLDESYRVLRPAGELIIVVPFLFQVHPSPRDYFRYTREALERLLTDTGFSQVVIEEIGTGPMAVRYQMLHNFLPAFLCPIWQAIALFEDRACTYLASLMGKKYAVRNYPLGYLVRATKP